MASTETLKRRELLDDWPANQPAPEITADFHQDAAEYIRQWQARYYYHPELFAAEVIGEPLDGTPGDGGQLDIAKDVANGHRLITVASGVGAGKTFLASIIACWLVATRNPIKIILTAPGAPQLHDAMLPELKKLFRRLPDWLRMLFEVKSDRIELKAAPEEVFISARTASADKPEIIQGIHEKNIVLIVDEASGMTDKTLVSAMGVMSSEDACMLMISNPTRLLGYFAESHRKREVSRMFRKHKLSHRNSKRVSPDYIAMIEAKFGKESNEYRIRVDGDFPDRDTDSFIPLNLVEDAMERDIAIPPGVERIWGMDVARGGADDCALAERAGPVVSWIESWHGDDTMVAVGRVHNKWANTPEAERPKYILVDGVGIGAGVADRLKELELPVRLINVAESPSMDKRYYRLRDELWDHYKEWLKTRTVKLPKVERLMTDSIAPRYEYLSDNRLKMESKDSMKSRGADSPDDADAVILTFARKTTYADGSGKRNRKRRGQRRVGAVA